MGLGWFRVGLRRVRVGSSLELGLRLAQGGFMVWGFGVGKDRLVV